MEAFTHTKYLVHIGLRIICYQIRAIINNNILRLQKMSFQQFLPFYAGLMVLVLIGVMFAVDDQTPKTVFFILIVMYIALLVYHYWRQQKKNHPQIKIYSLANKKSDAKRHTVLSGFESQANSILRQINLQNNYKANQLETYSQYSRTIQHPTSLSQLPTQSDQYYNYSQEVFYGTNNLQLWNQQFRFVQQKFQENLNLQIANADAYHQVLKKLYFNIDNLKQGETIVENFLRDRLSQYRTYAMKVVNESNKILSRNFGLNITNSQSLNPKQIRIDEFTKMVEYYRLNNQLPSTFQKILITAPKQSYTPYASSLKSHQPNRLELDMKQLYKYKQILQPMILLHLDRFNPCMLIYLIRQQFVKQIIKVNAVKDYMPIQNKRFGPVGGNFFNPTLGSRNRQQLIHYFFVQNDNWISLEAAPQFRTKNCLKICLIFFLVLIKKEMSTYHPVLRSIRSLLK